MKLRAAISIRLSQEVKDALEKDAKDQGRSLSNYCTLILSAAVKPKKGK